MLWTRIGNKSINSSMKNMEKRLVKYTSDRGVISRIYYSKNQ